MLKYVFFMIIRMFCILRCYSIKREIIATCRLEFIVALRLNYHGETQIEKPEKIQD